MQIWINKIKKFLFTFLVITLIVFSGFPSFNISKVKAADFTIQSGNYIGTGADNRAITGVGFQPDLVLLADTLSNGDDGFIFKTSAMSSEISSTISEAEAFLNTNNIQSLDSDGFTVGSDTDTNGQDAYFAWVAFGGSDCSASGTFCVGSYTGNGTSQNITSVGFQPDYVAVKRNGTTAGVFRTSSMPSGESAFFSIAANTTQAITSLNSNGFSVGNRAEANTSGNTYQFFAFKETSGKMDVGVYTGTGADNRIIDSSVDSGLTFNSDFAMIKGSAVNRPGVASFKHAYSADYSFLFTDAVYILDAIQKIYGTGGFQVGTTNNVNANTETYYYAVFGDSTSRVASDEDFDMVVGSYTGTGSPFSVTGLPFSPDLVTIKHQDQATDQHAVWRSSLFSGDRTSTFTTLPSSFTGGITALTSDGFSLGTSATTNTSGDTYFWTAFGNASRLDRTGNSDNFFLGFLLGGAPGLDDVNITPISITPEFVAIKPYSGNLPVYFRTASFVGDSASVLYALVANSNAIQSFFSNGFQIGGGLTTANPAEYFAFAGSDCSSSGQFCVGSYTGNGTSQNITSVGFQPDYIWIKNTNQARAGILRTSSQTGDTSSPFLNLPSLTGEITNFIKNGFSVGSGNGTNANAGSYVYTAWNAKRYTQAKYRFFQNTDSTDVGSVLAAQDTPAQLSSSGEAFRLRLLVRNDYGNLFTNGQDFNLQYVDKGSGSCSSPSGGTPASYTNVTNSTLIAFNNNSTPSNNTALTSNANDPTDGGRTITNQSYVEANTFTNSQSSILNTSQDGKWDFSLIDNGASPNTTFCFRIVFADGNVIDTYSEYPEITTVQNVPQSLSMSISDNAIGFGTLSSSNARYATSDTTGTTTDTSDAHTISVSTNASGGYVVIVNGETLSCENCSNGATINAIGGTPSSSSSGTEQFGIRGIVNSGTGSISSPYNTSNFALDTASFPDQFASGAGDAVTTEYGLRYLANISSTTDAGTYASTLTYVVTASF